MLNITNAPIFKSVYHDMCNNYIAGHIGTFTTKGPKANNDGSET